MPTIIASPPKGPVGDCQPSPPSSVPEWCANSGSEFQTIVPMKPTLTAANTRLASDQEVVIPRTRRGAGVELRHLFIVRGEIGRWRYND